MFDKVHTYRLLCKPMLWVAVFVHLLFAGHAVAQGSRMLRTVVVKPAPNMADTVILRAVERMGDNDYRNLYAFAYNFYNHAHIRRKGDTAYLFFSENAGRHLYLAPDHEREEILATRTTGTRKKIFASILSQLQSASFYKKEIDFLDMKFVNPLSPGTLSRYYFEMEDTIAQCPDTTFVISFRPRVGQDFAGFKGRVAISAKGYAMQWIEARPSGRFSNLTGNIMSGITTDMSFRHEFVCAPGDSRWLPRRYSTTFEITAQGETLELTAISDFIDFQTSPLLSRSDFRNTDDLEVDARSEHRDTAFWSSYRQAATPEEQRRAGQCYDLYDSLGTRLTDAVPMDNMLSLVEALADGHLPVWESSRGPVGINIDINSLYNHNDYEGARLGLGGELYRYLDGRDVKLSAGGYAAYGLRDRRLKYGASLSAAYMKGYRLKGSLFADNTVEPFANSSLAEYNLLDISGNAVYCNTRMVHMRRVGAAASWRQSRHWDFSVTARISDEDCLFNHYTVSESDFWRGVGYKELVLAAHWQSGVNKMSLSGEGVGSLSLSQRPSRASFTVEVTGGKSTASPRRYIRALAQYDHNIRLPRRGDLILNVTGGYATATAPATRLFSLGGTSNSRYYYRNSMLLIAPDAYLASLFVRGGACFVFERPLWKTAEYLSISSRPFLFLQTNAMYGTLHQEHIASPTSPVAPLVPVGVLVEPAVGLDGLLRWKILDAGLVGAYDIRKNAATQFLQNISVLFMLNVRID